VDHSGILSRSPARVFAPAIRRCVASPPPVRHDPTLPRFPAGFHVDPELSACPRTSEGTTSVWNTALYNLWVGRFLSLSTAVMVFPGILVALYLCLAGFLMAMIFHWDDSSVLLQGGTVLGPLFSLAGSCLALRWLYPLI
jgi:hypothetical protein